MCIRDRIKTWIAIWQKLSRFEKGEATVRWHKMYAHIQKLKNKWMAVRGPMSATITMLIEHGFRPTHPISYMYFPNKNSYQYAISGNEQEDKKYFLLKPFLAPPKDHPTGVPSEYYMKHFLYEFEKIIDSTAWNQASLSLIHI